MTKLTEHQFHTVWTNAVGMKGYDKQLFKDLFEKMKQSGEIVVDNPNPVILESDPNQENYEYVLGRLDLKDGHRNMSLNSIQLEDFKLVDWKLQKATSVIFKDDNGYSKILGIGNNG